MYVWHVRLLIYPESIVFSFVLLVSWNLQVADTIATNK